MTTYPHIYDRDQGHTTHFIRPNFCPIMSLEWVKLGISNLVYTLITSTSQCTIDRRACVQAHVTSFTFWELTDNVSETVQDTEIVTKED